MTGLSPVPPAAPSGSARPADPQLLLNLEAAAAAFTNGIAGLTDADVRAPSALPGWTRGHVLTHVAGVAEGMARQLEYAARGEQIELYDGGADGRNHAIEQGAVRGADRQRADLDRALEKALAAFSALSADGWNAPISYRNGVVRDGGLALWRELVIHLTDLGIGVGADTWTPEFCGHLFGFLQARVPAGLRLRLLPFGLQALTLAGPDGRAGTGPALGQGGAVTTVSVSGLATDLAAWLAGRTPNLGSLRAEAAADGVELPVLLPWPSALPAR